MIIGNQLYIECSCENEEKEMKVENIPAVFTIGPYVVNVVLYEKVQADSMFKKSQCMLEKVKFTFSTNIRSYLLYSVLVPNEVLRKKHDGYSGNWKVYVSSLVPT